MTAPEKARSRPRILDEIARLSAERRDIEQRFRAALQRARPGFSWRQIADVAGLSAEGVRYLTLSDEERARWNDRSQRARRTRYVTDEEASTDGS